MELILRDVDIIGDIITILERLLLYWRYYYYIIFYYLLHSI